jgi:hypothetical protein
MYYKIIGWLRDVNVKAICANSFFVIYFIISYNSIANADIIIRTSTYSYLVDTKQTAKSWYRISMNTSSGSIGTLISMTETDYIYTSNTPEVQIYMPPLGADVSKTYTLSEYGEKITNIVTEQTQDAEKNLVGDIITSGIPSPINVKEKYGYFLIKETVYAYPEPSTTLLMGIGAVGMGYAKRRKARSVV